MPAPGDLERVLHHLVDELGDRVLGAYAVAGELAVVVGDRLDEAALSTLDAVDCRVWLADAADLRSPMTVGRRWPTALVPGGLQPSAERNTAAHRWLLRERSDVLRGPPAADLVAEVTADALRAEALGQTRRLAEALDDDPSGSSVLEVCRALHTAEHGEVVDARTAAAWARGVLARHVAVIDEALASPVPVAATVALARDAALLAGEAALRSR